MRKIRKQALWKTSNWELWKTSNYALWKISKWELCEQCAIGKVKAVEIQEVGAVKRQIMEIWK